MRAVLADAWRTFESAAHPGLSESESLQAAVEGALLQAGAVLVAAFTGVVPWV